jgi:isoleucyl-tRNA synthetase
MQEIRTLATLGRAARESAGVNVRQPLAKMVCVLPKHGEACDAFVRELVPLLAAELNVKVVEFASSADALVSLEAKPNFRALGQRWGKETPRAAAAVAALSTETLRAFERGEPVIIGVDGTDHQLTPDEVTIHRRASGPLVVQEDGARFAALDTTVTPELRSEGIAREIVSRVQRLRKDSGLAVSDRIRLQVAGSDALRAIAETHRQWIAGEVLAREMIVTSELSADPSAIALELDGMTAHLALTRDA